jgi:hypothetical protein
MHLSLVTIEHILVELAWYQKPIYVPLPPTSSWIDFFFFASATPPTPPLRILNTRCLDNLCNLSYS